MKRAVRKFKETVEIRSSFVNRMRCHRYFPAAVLVCAVMVVCCFHIWQRVRVMALVKEVAFLERDNAELANNLKKVSSEISSLKMAARIQQYAADTLGLELISADRLYTLVPDKAETGPPDDMATLRAVIRRIARYVPTLTESSVKAGETPPLEIDSAMVEGNHQ